LKEWKLNNRQIDSTFFSQRVELRAGNLPDRSPLKVLDLLGGGYLLWEEVRKRTAREIDILRIEKKGGKKGFYLIGDSRKFLFDYGDFDVVDLDGPGCPFLQLDRVMNAPRRPKTIFLTWIQQRPDKLPMQFLNALGYPEPMVSKIPAIFAKGGQDKLLNYLALKAIKRVKMYFTPDRRKTFLSFQIEG